MPRVYVPNKSAHDFSKAEAYGELVFITEGLVDRYGVNQLARECLSATEDAEADDLILVSSLPVITCLLGAIFAKKFGKINFLLFKPGSEKAPEEYVKRTVSFEHILG
jgi:hypothetical protein